MHSVKVRRTGISADQAAEVIRRGLGDGYRIQPAGDEVLLRKGPLVRAKAVLRQEDGGTVFDVQGEGIWLVVPLSWAITRQINERGIASRMAEVISQAQDFS